MPLPKKIFPVKNLEGTHTTNTLYEIFSAKNSKNNLCKNFKKSFCKISEIVSAKISEIVSEKLLKLHNLQELFKKIVSTKIQKFHKFHELIIFNK